MPRPTFNRQNRPLHLPQGLSRKTLHETGIIIPSDGNICITAYALKRCMNANIAIKGALITEKLFAELQKPTGNATKKMRVYAKAYQLMLEPKQLTIGNTIYYIVTA